MHKSQLGIVIVLLGLTVGSCQRGSRSNDASSGTSDDVAVAASSQPPAAGEQEASSNSQDTAATAPSAPAAAGAVTPGMPLNNSAGNGTSTVATGTPGK
jgi:hypothetical protein